MRAFLCLIRQELTISGDHIALSQDMWDDGYSQIVNVDYSSILIERMKQQHETLRSSMQWIVGDVKALPLEDSSFDVAIDKGRPINLQVVLPPANPLPRCPLGTMDALMALEKNGDVWNPAPEVVQACKDEVDEALRVLRPGGRFIYITFGQPHFRLPHLRREGCTVQTVELGDMFH